MEMIEKDFLLLSTDALSNSMKPNDVLDVTKKESDFKKLPKLFLNIGLSHKIKDDISFIVVKDSKEETKKSHKEKKENLNQPIRKKKVVNQTKPLKKDQEPYQLQFQEHLLTYQFLSLFLFYCYVYS